MNERLTWIGRTDSGVVRQRLYDRDIKTLLLSPLDPGRKAWDVAIRKEGGQTGRFIDPHWYGLAGDGNALAFRKVCDAACAELQSSEMLMVDLEMVSKEYVRRLFEGAAGNRGLVDSSNPAYSDGTQSMRPIGYTNMPFQDGTVVPVDVLVNSVVTWWPQFYYGDMSLADPAAVVLEIARWGFAASAIRPFYDGKLISPDQRDGGYFTAERIPGVWSAARASASFMLDRGAPRPDPFWTKDDLRAHYSQLAKAA